MTRDEIAEMLWNAVPGPDDGSDRPDLWTEVPEGCVRDALLAEADAVVALVAERERVARARALEDAVTIAKGACRAGEKCMTDGGCRHVPCITARQIVADIEWLAAPPQPEAK